jgi:hypothetical protein
MEKEEAEGEAVTAAAAAGCAVDGALRAKRAAEEDDVDDGVFEDRLVVPLSVGSAMTVPAVSNLARIESKWSGM